MCRGCREVVKTGWQVVRPMDGFVSQLTIKLVFLIHTNSENFDLTFMTSVDFRFKDRPSVRVARIHARVLSAVRSEA